MTNFHHICQGSARQDVGFRLHHQPPQTQWQKARNEFELVERSCAIKACLPGLTRALISMRRAERVLVRGWTTRSSCRTHYRDSCSLFDMAHGLPLHLNADHSEAYSVIDQDGLDYGDSSTMSIMRSRSTTLTLKLVRFQSRYFDRPSRTNR